jgi:hypothetical protein
MAKQSAKATRAPAAKGAARRPVGKPSGKPDSTVADVSAAVASLTGAISADKLNQLPPELLQQLMAVAIRAYSAKVQGGEKFLPFDDRKGRVSPTDIMITASAMLKAGDLQVFELGMWQSYTGR